MSLRTRLFLFIGLLLCGMTAAVYLIPSYLGEKRVAQVHQQVLNWLQQLNQTQNQKTARWLQEAIYGLQAEIDAFLYLVDRTPEIQASFLTPSSKTGNWEAASDLMLYNSHLDFFQSQIDEEKATVLALGGAHIYPVLRAPITGNLQWIITEADMGGGPYIGVVGEHLTSGYPNRCFLFEPATLIALAPALRQAAAQGLVSSDSKTQAVLDELGQADQVLLGVQQQNGLSGPEELTNWINQQMAEAKKKFEQLPEGRLLVQEQSMLGAISPYLGLAGSWGEPIPLEHSRVDKDLFIWRVIGQAERFDEMRMLQELGRLLEGGFLGESATSVYAMAGVVKFSGDDRAGVAILSHDFLSTQPTFDGMAHFEAHAPPAAAPPIATTMGTVSNIDLLQVSLVNTLRMADEQRGEAYLTVGTAVGFIAWELAQHTSATAFAVYKGQIISGFGINGRILGPGMLTSFEQYLRDGGSAKGNQITVDGEEYFVASFDPYPEWGITFYTATSAAQYLYLLDWITTEAQQIVKEASRRLLIIAFGVLILALILLEIIAKQVTKPITSLADATALVVEGRYDAVKLPDVPEGSHNEVSVLTIAFKNMVRGLVDRERIRAVLNKCVSKEVADELLSHPIEVGGEVKEAAVLFADIRNFTGLTERMEPQEVISLLNEYMTWVSTIIDHHRGVIDKYIGDEVMALYGAPLPMDHAALQAIATAIQLMARLREWNGEREARGLRKVNIGIGVHYGEMVAGNMGGEQRQNYTVLGANVNLASRLCSEAEPMEILITERTYLQPDVADHISVEEHGLMQFKGFSEPMKTYRVVGFKDREGLEEHGIRTQA